MYTARFLSLRTKIFVAGDENLLCAGNKYQRFLSLTTILNIKDARNLFSSLTTKDKIFVTSDKSCTLCARLKREWLNTEITITSSFMLLTTSTMTLSQGSGIRDCHEGVGSHTADKQNIEKKKIYHTAFIFHFILFFILKFFKEGNPSAKMLVFKGPSN